MTKICTKCNVEKDINEFSIRNNRPCGYQAKCKKCESLYSKKYYKKNIKKINDATKKYTKAHADYYVKIKKIWRTVNKTYINYKFKLKKETDPEFKLLCLLRTRLNTALQNNQKSGHTIDLIGCSISDLKSYLGITGIYDGSKWHIDHIIPCALYDLSIPGEQYKCFNWRNLRLIDAMENLEKKDKLDWELIKLLKIEDLLPEII
jgi:hypothetical protein